MSESNQQPTRPLVAEAGMLIRRPANEVFEAIVNPEITTKFWFTKSSGRLEPGARVTWEWEMYGASTEVEVTSIQPGEQIVMNWGLDTVPTTVEWTFESHADGTTFISVTNSGFTGSEREIADQVIDSTGGFSLVLAGLKAFLEHGIELNLVADRHPSALVQH